MQKTKEIPFKDVKVGQEFASIKQKRAWGGFKINTALISSQEGRVVQKAFTADAVLVFDHAGNRPDDAGALLSVDPEEKVHIFVEEGSKCHADSSTVIGSLLEDHMGESEKSTAHIVRLQGRKLTDTRTAVTHKFEVAGHEGYLTVGLFEDNTPGELFITMAKEGSTIGGLFDSIATLTSLALQSGIPLEVMVKEFVNTRFEPSGFTNNAEIRNVASIIDYVFRWLALQFIPGYKEREQPAVSVDQIEQGK